MVGKRTQETRVSKRVGWGQPDPGLGQMKCHLHQG